MILIPNVVFKPAAATGLDSKKAGPDPTVGLKNLVINAGGADMTDRIKGLSVSLTHDIRDDDCQAIIDAIKMVKGVEAVEMHVTTSDDWML